MAQHALCKPTNCLVNGSETYGCPGEKQEKQIKPNQHHSISNNCRQNHSRLLSDLFKEKEGGRWVREREEGEWGRRDEKVRREEG